MPSVLSFMISANSRALSVVDEAIAHTPTLVELYNIKVGMRVGG